MDFFIVLESVLTRMNPCLDSSCVLSTIHSIIQISLAFILL